MGCKQVKVGPSSAETSELKDVNRKSELSVKTEQKRPAKTVPSVSFDLSPVDKDAFSTVICQQRQKAIDNMTYRKTIDRWRPSSIEELIKSIEKLAPKENQIDRAWIIFYWISQNIRYDTDAFFNNRIGSQNGQDVFQSGKAVCEGYSSLYADLCNRTGIPCEKVSGYSKGFGFDPRQTKFDKTDHAWNIIRLEQGHSYFVESTWGSGHLSSSSQQYKQELVSHYFLCPPEHMIYGHLPEDNRKQLLAQPITMQQYLMLPHVHSAFFVHHLHVVSPVCSAKVDLVQGDAYGLLLIGASSGNVKLSGSLEDKDGTKIKGGSLVHQDKKDQTVWQCKFAPPKPGKYNIVIYAKSSTDSDQTSYTSAVEFAFDVDRLPCPAISYPTIWPKFIDYDLEIIKPKNSYSIDWSSNKNTFYCEILLRAPDHISISATMNNAVKGTNVENGTLVNFDSTRKLWQCLFAPSSAEVPFELTLFGKQTEEKQSHCVAKFELPPIPKTSLKQCMTFPSMYSIFNEFKCHIMEPLNGVLQRNSTTHFRCRIPGARVVNITIDGAGINGDGLKPDENGVFESDIRVGSKEVTIWAKFDDQDSSYKGLLKYAVR